MRLFWFDKSFFFYLICIQIVQWLYQNLTDSNNHQLRTQKIHWRPLFLNTQSLTPSETRYSIQQKIQQANDTSISHSTILTLSKVTYSDEGLYMCKSLSPKTIQMAYQVRVIQSLDIVPKYIFIPTNETGQYSIRLNCILTDNHTGRRHHEIHWWHNNKRLGSHSNRQARITKNVTQNSFISTLFYTGEPSTIAGNYICESDPLRKYISVGLKTNRSSSKLIEVVSFFFYEYSFSCLDLFIHWNFYILSAFILAKQFL